jgi:hypothetical protein
MEFNGADWNTAIAWLDKEIVNQWMENEGSSVVSVEWLQNVHKWYSQSYSSKCSIAATTWRKPFCIHGFYTKTRRDVSQTPFYVTGSCTKELLQSQSI